MHDKTLVFTDGAAKGNPGPAGWGAIIAVPQGQVREIGGRSPRATNNQMELRAIIEGLREVRDVEGEVAVLTDSSYVLQGITSWIKGWKRRGWKTAGGTAVLNQSYWEELDELATEFGSRVSWHKVKGHAGIPGNERADEIASGYAEKSPPELYDGSLLEYQVAIYDIPEDTSIKKRSSKSNGSSPSSSRKRSGKAHCYLSYVDGALEQHATWAQCERRVKGRSGAKFKKAMTPGEVSEIKQQWGLS